MASRVAALLKKETNEQVELVRGGLGEFSVYVDGRKIINTNRLWYPRPSEVVRKMKALLAE